MKFTLMKMMILNCSLTPMAKSPMIMGIMLILQTMFMILFLNKISLTSWFPMITFLMMVGGLLILFMYMSSIATNQKMKLKINLTFIFILMIMLTDELMISMQINETQEMLFNTSDLSLIKIYNKKSMLITMMMVIYLLLTMISTSKIIKQNEGPLRLFKNYE